MTKLGGKNTVENSIVWKSKELDSIFSDILPENNSSNDCEKKNSVVDYEIGDITNIKNGVSSGIDFIGNSGPIIGNTLKKADNTLNYSCGKKCNIAENDGCNNYCDNFNSNLEKSISELLDTNSSDSYSKTAKYFNTLSGGKLDIDFHKTIDTFDKDLIYYFNYLFEGEIDYEKIVLSYELINKYFIINHGNNIESHFIYGLSETILSLLYNFIEGIEDIENPIDSKGNKINFLNLENLIHRFNISHSFLKEIDYASNESALKSFKFILNKIFSGYKGLEKNGFNNLKGAKSVFLINYSYIYGLYLRYIDENNLDDDLSNQNKYFNFEKDGSIKEKKDLLFNTSLDLLKEDIFSDENYLMEFKNNINNLSSTGDVIDCFLNYFIEKGKHNGYNSTMFLEVIHNIFSLYPNEVNISPFLLQFARKMILNNEDGNYAYNVMKLRVLKYILKLINGSLFEIEESDQENILLFLGEIEDNMKEYGSDFLFIYSRIKFGMANIYSGFYKTKSLELKKINKDSEQYKKSKEILNKIKEEIFLSLSFYEKIHSGNEEKDIKDNYSYLKKSIIKKFLYKYGKSDFEDLEDLYRDQEEAFFDKKKSDIHLSINSILNNIIENHIDKEFNYGFKNINKVLVSVSKFVFKDIIDIKMIKKNDLVLVNTKVDNHKIDLGFGYILNFNINKKFNILFKKILEEEDNLIEKIKYTLSRLVKSYKKLYYNETTNLKNGYFFDSEIDSIEKKSGEGVLILLESNIINYTGGTKEEREERANFFIKKNAQMLNNIDLGIDYKFFHVGKNKFVYLIEGGNNKDFIVEKIKNQIKEKKDLDTLSLNISGYDGVLDKNSLDKSLGDKTSTIKIDIKAEAIIEDVVKNRPEDVLIYLQPIVNNIGIPVKYECLTRIRIDKSKPISPKNTLPPDKIFNALSARDKLYYKFTSTQIEKSFEIIKNKNVDLSINLSIKDLFEHGESLISLLDKLLKEYGVNFASNITFEILEYAMDPSESSYVMDIMGKIKDRGFKIAIDDFGAGESNSIRVMEMRDYIDIVKLDESFVHSIRKDKENYNNFLTEIRAMWFKKFKDKLSKESLEKLGVDGDVASFVNIKNILDDLKNLDMEKFLNSKGDSLFQKLHSYKNDFLEGILKEGVNDWNKDFNGFLKKKIENNNLSLDMKKFIDRVAFLSGEIETFKRKKDSNVICEYIEDKNVADFFSFIGVDLFQGYHFSKPFYNEELS